MCISKLVVKKCKIDLEFALVKILLRFKDIEDWFKYISIKD
jgi:hypothetical protein